MKPEPSQLACYPIKIEDIDCGHLTMAAEYPDTHRFGRLGVKRLKASVRGRPRSVAWAARARARARMHVRMALSKSS